MSCRELRRLDDRVQHCKLHNTTPPLKELERYWAACHFQLQYKCRSHNVLCRWSVCRRRGTYFTARQKSNNNCRRLLGWRSASPAVRCVSVLSTGAAEGAQWRLSRRRRTVRRCLIIFSDVLRTFILNQLLYCKLRSELGKNLPETEALALPLLHACRSIRNDQLTSPTYRLVVFSYVTS